MGSGEKAGELRVDPTIVLGAQVTAEPPSIRPAPRFSRPTAQEIRARRADLSQFDDRASSGNVIGVGCPRWDVESPSIRPARGSSDPPFR